MHAYLRQARQLEAAGKGDGKRERSQESSFFCYRLVPLFLPSFSAAYPSMCSSALQISDAVIPSTVCKSARHRVPPGPPFNARLLREKSVGAEKDGVRMISSTAVRNLRYVVVELYW